MTDHPEAPIAETHDPDWLSPLQRSFTRANIARYPDAKFPYRALLPLLDALDATLDRERVAPPEGLREAHRAIDATIRDAMTPNGQPCPNHDCHTGDAQAAHDIVNRLAAAPVPDGEGLDHTPYEPENGPPGITCALCTQDWPCTYYTDALARLAAAPVPDALDEALSQTPPFRGSTYDGLSPQEGHALGWAEAMAHVRAALTPEDGQHE
jgi:hypothetical protein